MAAKKHLSPYAQKLLDPRWQKMRLQVLERDEFSCTSCGDSEKTLFVHHGYYIFGNEPWDYPLDCFHTVCEDCHRAAEVVREEMKILVGSLSIDAQYTLLVALQHLSAIGYGDMLCSLTMLRDDEIRSAALTAWSKKIPSAAATEPGAK